MRGGAMIRVTIACPESLIGDANQLASCIGLGPEDAQTYGAAVWLDAAGNRYAVASAIVPDRFAADASSPLHAPDWGANMAAAGRAKSLIRLGEPASPDILAASIGDDVHQSLSILGVTAIEDDSA